LIVISMYTFANPSFRGWLGQFKREEKKVRYGYSFIACLLSKTTVRSLGGEGFCTGALFLSFLLFLFHHALIIFLIFFFCNIFIVTVNKRVGYTVSHHCRLIT